MSEQLQRLASPVVRSSLTLQTRTFDGPHAVRGQLSAILGFGPDGEAARQGAACIGQLPNDPSPDGGKQAGPHQVALQMPAMVSLRLSRCKEFTPKTTESHWSGGQREP